MTSPSFDSQGNAGGATSGNGQSINVSAVGGDEIIVVVASILVESITEPVLGISTVNPNIGAWTSIAKNFGQTSQSGTWSTILQAWWAPTSGPVSNIAVTVSSDQIIKGVCLGYFSLFNPGSIFDPLDPNSSLPVSEWDPANLEPAISTSLPNDMAIWLFGSNVVSPTITAVPNLTAQEFMKQGFFTANNIITVAGVYDTIAFESQQSNLNFGSSLGQGNCNLIVFAVSGGYDVQDSVVTSDALAFTLTGGVLSAELNDTLTTGDIIFGPGSLFRSISDATVARDAYGQMPPLNLLMDSVVATDSYAIPGGGSFLLRDTTSTGDALFGVGTSMSRRGSLGAGGDVVIPALPRRIVIPLAGRDD